VARALAALVTDSCDPKYPSCRPHALGEYWPLLVFALVALAVGVTSVVVIAVFVVRRRRRHRPEGPVDVTLQPDGSLLCRWNGRHGLESAVYVPQHESYPKLMDAVAGIQPGETRRIERLPD
jgi:hypothetical protein